MMRPVVLGGAALLLAALVAGCSSSQDETAPSEDVVRPLLSMVVERSHARQSGPFIGTVESRQEVSLGFKQAGRLIARSVDTGDQVDQGAVVATLDNTVLAYNVDQARADLANAEAVLENAEGSYDRVTQLVERGTSSQSQLDAAQAALNSARAQRASAQTALNLAEQNLADANLTAPFAGVITSVSSEVGEVVDAGQAVATLARPDVLDAVIDVPEQLALQLDYGDRMQIALKANDASRATGRVREIAASADPYSRTRRVRLALEDDTDAFRIGSMVSVTPMREGEGEILVPDTAILEQEDASYVWVVDPDNLQVEQRQVTTSETASGLVVIAEGIEAGERIATAGVHSLAPGQQVRIMEN